MATHAHSTRTPLLPPSRSPQTLLGEAPQGPDISRQLAQKLGRQPGPVTIALAAMHAADPERQHIRELRRRIARRIQADIALLDALDGDPDLETENEHGGDIQDEPHDPEEDCDPDAIIDRGTPRRYRGADYRKNEVVAEARMGLDAVRRRKAGSAPAGALRIVALPLGYRS